jgi:two-component system, OmpR family, sensor kinase
VNQSSEAATDVFRVVPDAQADPLSPRGAIAPRGDGRLSGLRHAIRAALSSYRLRIVGWFIALLALGTLATILVVGQLLFARIDNGVRETLLREASEFRLLASGNDPLTGQPFGGNVGAMFDAYIDRHFPGPNDMAVTFIDGQVYRRSSAEPRYRLEQDPAYLAAVANVADTTAGRLQTPIGAVDYLAVPVRVDGVQRGVLSVASFRDAAAAEQEDIILATLGVGLVLLVIGSVLAWRLADRLLAPVARTAATARAISETDLTQRVEVRGYDEVAQLARTLNDMLDRLQASFADQRHFLDDVGHELRTPLTIVRGHLELLDEGTPQEQERTRDLVLDELDRMTRLVNELLTLAQSARPDFLRRTEIDASELLGRIQDKAVVLADRDWRTSAASTGLVSCDPQRITQALLQLAANAVRHTERGKVIELGCRVDADQARFWVRDEGAGIEPAETARIFERFYRSAGQSRQTGSGLGLSIVAAIAAAHGGRAEVESELGSGSTFSVVIPRAAPKA